MNKLAPKARFLDTQGNTPQGGPAAKWADLAASGSFQEAVETAFAEFAMRLTSQGLADAGAAYFKLEGAKEFIGVLLNLGEKEIPRLNQPVKPLHNT